MFMIVRSVFLLSNHPPPPHPLYLPVSFLFITFILLSYYLFSLSLSPCLLVPLVACHLKTWGRVTCKFTANCCYLYDIEFGWFALFMSITVRHLYVHIIHIPMPMFVSLHDGFNRESFFVLSAV